MDESLKKKHEVELVEGFRMDVGTFASERARIMAQTEVTEDGTMSLSLSDLETGPLLIVNANAIQNVLRLAMEAQAPRLLARRELLEGWGHGWMEEWLGGEDGEPDVIVVKECVWLPGMVMISLDETGYVDQVEGGWFRDHYNQRDGCRVWAGGRAPTDEERRAKPWS